MTITLIAAVARNRVIGRDGGLPWKLPDDLARFKALTMGKPVVMGRKTFDSIGKRPLRGRTNIVITRQPFAADGFVVAGSVAEANAAAGDAAELCVVGGEQIYALYLPIADCLELTEVDVEVEGDARFPPFSDEFALVSAVEHPADDRHAHAFRFATYRRQTSS